MSNAANIIKFEKSAGQPLNILTCSTHERYESMLAKTGHNFYAIRIPTIVKDWNTNYAPIPDNYGLLDFTKNTIPGTEDLIELAKQQLPADMRFDLVLSQNKFGQFQILARLADHLNLPLISLEHTLPRNEWDAKKLSKVRDMKGDCNIFISEYSRDRWGWNKNNAEVIHHCVDTDKFKPGPERGPYALSVCNDWVNRDYFCGFKLWQKLVNVGRFPVRVIGDTPGLSKPAKDVDELAGEYGRAAVFINTSLISPIPTALMEAMAAGCAVVTTNTCMIPEVVKHGVNGFLFDPTDPDAGAELVKTLLDDQVLAVKLGAQARETIKQNFSVESHLSKWNSLFYKVANAKRSA